MLAKLELCKYFHQGDFFLWFAIKDWKTFNTLMKPRNLGIEMLSNTQKTIFRPSVSIVDNQETTLRIIIHIFEGFFRTKHTFLVCFWTIVIIFFTKWHSFFSIKLIYSYKANLEYANYQLTKTEFDMTSCWSFKTNFIESRTRSWSLKLI